MNKYQQTEKKHNTLNYHKNINKHNQKDRLYGGPLQGEKTPKWEKDPHELYNIITPKEREKYYEQTPEEGYNVPLLKDSERRKRNLLRRRARDSSYTDFDQGT